MGQLTHFLFKQFAVIFHFGGPHIAARGEHVVVGFDVLNGDGFAETGNIVVLAVFGFSPPGVVGAGNLGNVVGGQFLMNTADHAAHIAGVDKQGFALAVAVVAVVVAGNDCGLFVFGDKPEAHRNLGGVEELAGQRDHAVYQVVFDNLFTDFPFALGVGAHGAVGQYKARDAVVAELADHVQYPTVVGVAGGGHFVTGPAGVVGEFVGAAPLFQVKGRVGHDEVGLQVRVLVFKEGVGGNFAQVGADAANGQVHLGQLVGGAGLLLPVDGDVLLVTLVVLHKFDRLHEHAAGAAAGVVDFSVVGLDHFGNQVDHALGGIELAPALAFGGGKVAEEVFVDAADYVDFARGAVHFAGGAIVVFDDGIDVVDGVDQGGQLAYIQPQAGEVVIGQRAFEGFVVLLHSMQGGVNLDGDVVLLGILGDVIPATLFRQVEDVFHGVELHHVDIVALAFGDQFLFSALELVADELEEDQGEDDVLVFGGFDRASELVGGVPEGLFKALVFF